METPEIEKLAVVKKRHILAAYEILGKNKAKTAAVLGIGIRTLQRNLKRWNVQ